MKRSTIAEVAKLAGVSLSTVDRVLNQRAPVRKSTTDVVIKAARQLGYLAEAAGAEKIVLGFLLLQSFRPFYRNIASSLENAVTQIKGAKIEIRIDFVDDLAPQKVAKQLLELGNQVDAVGVVAAEYPEVVFAIETLHSQNKPVCSLISNLSAGCSVGYVGLDNRKVGRAAAWGLAHLCKKPGKLGIMLGSHRYRCQEQNEIGFRSYLREFGPNFTILEPFSTFENPEIAEEMTHKILREEPDLTGLYVAGGELTGVLKALKETEHSENLVVVGHELIETTRKGLMEETLSLVIAHPIEQLAREGISALLDSLETPENGSLPMRNIPFELYISENI